MKTLFKISALVLFGIALTGCGADSMSSENFGGPSVGQGGSLATFAIANDHLFVLTADTLSIFGLSDPAKPNFISKQFLGFDMETVFPRDNQTLFFGARNGMHIYDISNAPVVSRLSMTQHIVACDPVVADQTHAYVTLRSLNEGFCGGNINVMQVYDITDLRTPMQVNQINMVGPMGLAIDQDFVYVCDGGIRVLERSNPANPVQVNYFQGIDAKDIIIGPKSLIILGNSGISQYSYSNGNLNKLSNL